MGKAWRIEYEGALYLLMSQGNDGQLRAGIVSRLIDYKWSSYPIYAYAEKGPDWLSTQVILSYFKGSNKHKQYREMVQKYAKEEKRLLEDLHYGMILGSKKFDRLCTLE